VGGLPWLNPAELSPKDQKKKFKKKKNFNFFFGLSLLGAGGPAALRGVACEKEEFFFLIFFFWAACAQQATLPGPLRRNFYFILFF
jgi:hypothetical protein